MSIKKLRFKVEIIYSFESTDSQFVLRMRKSIERKEKKLDRKAIKHWLSKLTSYIYIFRYKIYKKLEQFLVQYVFWWR